MNRAARIVAIVVALASSAAGAQWADGPWGSGSSGGGGGGTFTGGTLTSQLLLDATNTLCSQTLSLAWNGDDDTGFQRSAANTMLLCIGGAVGLTLTSTLTTVAGDLTVSGNDLDAAAAAFNVGASATSMNLTGGSASTGCTIDASGNFACSGTVGGGPFLALGGGTMTGAITFSAIANELTSGTNENIDIAPNGTGFIGCGSTTLCKIKSNVTATGGTDNFFVVDTVAGSGFTDRTFTVRGNGSDEFFVTTPGAGTFASNITVSGGTLNFGSATGIITTLQSSNAVLNMSAASGANAIGEYAFVAGTNATLATTTLDTPIFSAAYDIDGTPVHAFVINGAGHVLIPGAIASADAGTGTCTAVTVSGSDLAGHITATCALNQTVIMTWGRAYGAAPRCQVTAANAAASIAAPFLTPATANLTLTVTLAAGVTGAQWDYLCIGAAT